MFLLKYGSSTVNIHAEPFFQMKDAQKRMYELWAEVLSNANHPMPAGIKTVFEYSLDVDGITAWMSETAAKVIIDGDSCTDYYIEEIPDSVLGVDTPMGRMYAEIYPYDEYPGIRIMLLPTGAEQAVELAMTEHTIARPYLGSADYKGIPAERISSDSTCILPGLVTRVWPCATPYTSEEPRENIYHYGFGDAEKLVSLVTYRVFNDEELNLQPEDSPLIRFTIRRASLQQLIDIPVDTFLHEWTYDSAAEVYLEAKKKCMVVSETGEPCYEREIVKLLANAAAKIQTDRFGSASHKILLGEISDCEKAINAFQRRADSVLIDISSNTTSASLRGLIDDYLEELAAAEAAAVNEN